MTMKKDSSTQHAGFARMEKETTENELPNQNYRIKALRFLMGMTVICNVFFGYINWESHFLMASLELSMALYAMLLMPLTLQNKLQFKISLMFLLPLYSLFLYGLILSREPQIAVVWILVIPVLSHFLLGRLYGLWISVSFMLLAGIIFLVQSVMKGEQIDMLLFSNQVFVGMSILVFSHINEVSRVGAHRKLLYLATTDNLTSLANRTRFLDVFERERNHAARNNSELALLLLDLDHFKQVNDRFGHDVGDEVLKYVATTISNRLRKTDLACRLGGEEFAILLPGVNLKSAVGVAEIVRKSISDIPYVKGDVVIPLSVSIGVAEYGYDGKDLEGLYAVADKLLYEAKAGGRNQVCSRTLMRNCELDLALAN